jgi:2-phosphosulfolactate phosphatase
VELVRRQGLDGAAQASGPTVVIDTFRAFTACAFAVAGGIDRIVLAAELDEARHIAARLSGALLGGEERGIKPDDFDIGNSPGEFLALGDLGGRTLVHRTSAGTRCARAALDAGARPLWAASLVVAGATFREISGCRVVTVVPSGRYGTEQAPEDDAVADYFDAAVAGNLDSGAIAAAVAATDRAHELAEASWVHPDDLDLCLDVDRFDFAMEVVRNGDLVELRPVGSPRRTPRDSAAGRETH